MQRSQRVVFEGQVDLQVVLVEVHPVVGARVVDDEAVAHTGVTVGIGLRPMARCALHGGQYHARAGLGREVLDVDRNAVLEAAEREVPDADGIER